MATLTQRLDRIAPKAKYAGGVMLIQDEGQTEEDAVRAYEAEHGPIPPDKIKIIHTIISPKPRPE